VVCSRDVEATLLLFTALAAADLAGDRQRLRLYLRAITAAAIPISAPAIFAIQGTPQAIAVNGDGSVTAPAGAIMGVTSHPAMAGDAISFYASGLGPVNPSPPPSGAPSLDALRQTTNPLTVLVGGMPAQVVFSGLAPQFTGVYQVNIVVPTGAAGPAVTMQLMIGVVTSPDALTIVKQ
jgi:uncharacterized protein (TIGR03437 family)